LRRATATTGRLALPRDSDPGCQQKRRRHE
jgi:hypothetical protein